MQHLDEGVIPDVPHVRDYDVKGRYELLWKEYVLDEDYDHFLPDIGIVENTELTLRFAIADDPA